MSSLGVAIVTGAPQGMGQAIALRLADGFGVAINDLPSAKDNLESLSEELTSKGRRTYYIVAADVSVEAEVQSMVSTVVEKLGELNVYGGIQMIKQGRGGRITSAASSAAHRGRSGFSAYSASKFAVRGLTQTAALEWGRHKITVNIYAPGLTKTPLTAGLAPHGTSVDDLFAKWEKDSLLGYIGMPVDVASLVSYLASKESHFITGKSLGVNGGSLMR